MGSNRNIQWNSTYDELGDNHALFVVQTDDDGFALAGTTKSTDEGAHYDIWFAKVDASGEVIPEFPSWAILPLLVVATLVGVIIRNKIRKNGLE